MFGLNPNTVRTWERRYGFPTPERSEGGQRGYTAADIARISEIMNHVKTGASIASAIQQAKVTQQLKAPEDLPDEDQFKQLRLMLRTALESHNPLQLSLAIKGARAEVGYNCFIEQVAFPLLKELGNDWETTGTGVAAEHVLTNAISGIIFQETEKLSSVSELPRFVFACAPGEQHQLPLMHLANRVTAAGLAFPISLGAGLPVEEILNAAKTSEAKLIVLSATMPVPPAAVREWLAAFVHKGWGERVVLAGPGFSRSRIFTILPIKAAVGDFSQVVESLKLMLSHTSD